MVLSETIKNTDIASNKEVFKKDISETQKQIMLRKHIQFMAAEKKKMNPTNNKFKFINHFLKTGKQAKHLI